MCTMYLKSLWRSGKISKCASQNKANIQETRRQDATQKRGRHSGYRNKRKGQEEGTLYRGGQKARGSRQDVSQ